MRNSRIITSLVLPFGLALARRAMPRKGSLAGSAVGGVQGFQAGGWLAPVGKHEAFALGGAAQYALGVLAEFEHGHGLHELKFKLELKGPQLGIAQHGESSAGRGLRTNFLWNLEPGI